MLTHRLHTRAFFMVCSKCGFSVVLSSKAPVKRCVVKTVLGPIAQLVRAEDS